MDCFKIDNLKDGDFDLKGNKTDVLDSALKPIITDVLGKDVIVSINRLTKDTYKKFVDKKFKDESVYGISQLRHETVLNMVSTEEEADNLTPVKGMNGQCNLKCALIDTKFLKNKLLGDDYLAAKSQY